ncbi:MAG: 3-deoxy-D-manno-octulosonic acid transferase [Croceivirga sp.]
MYFVEGMKKTFLTLQENLPTSKEIIWMHAASLGEYEQGLPVLEALKKVRPNYYYLLTFFSPSGYEVKKDSTPADLVMYLPMDTQKKARRFLDGIQPKIALFIKYEIWPNYLSELQNRHVPTFLVSGIFSKRQVYFKWYGGFMRKALKAFDHFFVQEDNSKKLLDAVGCQNVTISGDTRFDRVHEILHQENFLDFMERFKGNSKCFVAGSTWPEDEKIM